MLSIQAGYTQVDTLSQRTAAECGASYPAMLSIQTGYTQVDAHSLKNTEMKKTSSVLKSALFHYI
jgi:hypothetical protein